MLSPSPPQINTNSTTLLDSGSKRQHHGSQDVCTVCTSCFLCKHHYCYPCPMALTTSDDIGRHEPMHAVLHDATAVRHEPVHAVLHNATGVCHGQICLTGVYDAAATVDLTVPAVLDSKDDAVSTMSLWCHLTDHAATATTVHVQPDGYSDPAYVLPAALCWCSILDRCPHAVTIIKLTCHRM
ncbi:hypothetical protein SETIT_4G143200v2 [Setaria italica]|uniref:C2H2-type domain-containing protein n=1 Tax=Setaria italica TaxID=4555 RepID=A0A368QU89_SETIT|nr:hypothetical protein SETIT_4G143200v2 [Setaria italica]